MKGWERSSEGLSIRPLVFWAPQVCHRTMRMNLVQVLKSHWIDIFGFHCLFWHLFVPGIWLSDKWKESLASLCQFCLSKIDLTNGEFAGVEGLYTEEQNQSLFYATWQDFSQLCPESSLKRHFSGNRALPLLDFPSSCFAIRSSNARSNRNSTCSKASWMKFA